jgi:predicted dehydrogenase
VWLDPAGDLQGAGVRELAFEACNQFTLQAEAFARAILDDTPQPLPLEDSVRNMACIDAVFRSAQSGRWETP